MQLLRCANERGDRMRWDDGLIFGPKPKIGLITLCRVEVYAKPALQSARSAGG
jgi:hypothetical protein